jgi:hypothetical protein
MFLHVEEALWNPQPDTPAYVTMWGILHDVIP